MSFVVHRVAKSAARYTDAGGREKCGYCRFFVAPCACGKVIGPVSPAGWCKYFSRQVAQQYSGAGFSGGGGPPGMTLDLNFMSSGNMPAGVTFSRASPASYQDASGVIQTAAVNQPRWDYAGGSLRGLLIEEARTNLLLNSATLGTQSVTVTAQAYTLSFYGTGTVTESGAATGALVGTGAGQRVTQTFTPTAGTLTLTVTGSVLNAQIEVGGFVTSWMPTAGASATRAADIATMPTGSWFSPGAGTFMAEFMALYGSPTQGGILLVDDGTATNQAFIAYLSPDYIYDSGTIGGTSQLGLVPGGIHINGLAQRSAFRYGGGLWAGATSGVVAAGTGSAVPFNATRLAFGTNVSTALDQWKLNGHIRRVPFWNRALSDAELAQVTA